MGGARGGAMLTFNSGEPPGLVRSLPSRLRFRFGDPASFNFVPKLDPPRVHCNHNDERASC